MFLFAKSETEILGEAEALQQNFSEIRRVDGESPLQVQFCDAFKSALEIKTDIKSEDISLEDSGGLWDGWDGDFFDSLRKRPAELRFCSQLKVIDYIQGNSCCLPRIETSVSWSGGGLPCCVWELENLTTNCKRVLLAFDNAITDAIMPFVAQHASDYLVVVVGWDTDSYLFLRKLAHSVPGLTCIAITDLDHHHLDRLAFLAASPSELSADYGWDLSEECRLTGVNANASLDIKWLGLRPSDIDAHVACFKVYAFKQGETDFEMVIDRLLTIPSVTANKAWMDELQRLRDRPLFMAFSFLKPTRSPFNRYSYIKDVYLPQKLDKQNWV